MKIKIIFEENDLKRISIKDLMLFIKFFNTEKTQTHFKRMGGEFIEIIISEKNSLKNLCDEIGIKHFDKKEDYIKWLKIKNGHR